MKTLKTIAATAVLASMAAVAWAQMNHGTHGGGMMMNMDQMQSMMATMMPSDGDTDAIKAFKEADMEMMRGMAVNYTGDPDVDFRLKMIPHHQGAIDMAKVALQHTADEDTKLLARAIIAAQEREIVEMQAWLAKNRK
ncbi:DUF305 domain-containing protein [Tianweitania sediminis]|uniref:DUF305 domain-containing protein n=1 Tax=Tianweitania sediminis TaxID=1502156 RepID=A0A8J7R1T9_9HYPH|nr:DUF305 domain-containing protein [Tianweitania sediminis]MBP0439877.1 DUF305 domain-containing protein [Tianweitania sediminis]HEV7416953.1 DUF305 domain-containing protein [Tianweitania sediminis]